MEHLRLIALDTDDLAVISAHLQDALVTVENLAYLPQQKRFAAVLDRFDWPRALSEPDAKDLERKPSALRLERVLGAGLTGIDLAAKSTVLSLLAMQFSPKAAGDPEGYVTLMFAGGAGIRLHVECIEAELRDLLAGQSEATPDPVARIRPS
jgi:hypothetical protein